jgi:hypothetical protein
MRAQLPGQLVPEPKLNRRADWFGGTLACGWHGARAARPRPSPRRRRIDRAVRRRRGLPRMRAGPCRLRKEIRNEREKRPAREQNKPRSMLLCLSMVRMMF